MVSPCLKNCINATIGNCKLEQDNLSLIKLIPTELSTINYLFLKYFTTVFVLLTPYSRKYLRVILVKIQGDNIRIIRTL